MIDIDTSMSSGRVVSRDGTSIGYLRTGRGPAVVNLHGSMESARSHALLARALAGDFTVYLPDRRGRGMSGPHQPDHGVRTEVEDLQAVLAESGAQLAFGVSAGGLVVLEAARTLPGLRKIALYEPAVTADVLLLGGSKGLPFLKPGRDALAQTLPRSRRVEFPGLDHGASSDPSQTNPGGKPEIVGQVAREVRSFFVTSGQRQAR